MRILITGICGFVGSTLARAFLEYREGVEILGLDSLARPGSELNRGRLRELGVEMVHGDLRNSSDLSMLPAVDWVIDAAANPSVLAGVDGRTNSRQLVEHNLMGTVNTLEYCKKHRAGFLLLSTSRVYSIDGLARIEMEVVGQSFQPRTDQSWPAGCSPDGVNESFSTASPISLYGSTKLASEVLATEYGIAFNFPVWINRCGVLAGAGQFGRSDQGIFSFWIHSYARRKPLSYIGFEGRGFQVRDALHPRDLVPLLWKQMSEAPARPGLPLNLGGGKANSMSLADLSAWCHARFGPHAIQPEPTPRPYDIPWLMMDCQSAAKHWGWRPTTPLEDILEEIARHAEAHPDWLELTGH